MTCHDPFVYFLSVFCLTAEGKEEIEKVTFGELKRDVALYAAALRKMGLKIGDRVVGRYPFNFQTKKKDF